MTPYAFRAAKRASLFFSATGPRLSIIAAFGVFALGVVTRPLGGLIFGYMKDKI